jgi:hypothetical protein
MNICRIEVNNEMRWNERKPSEVKNMSFDETSEKGEVVSFQEAAIHILGEDECRIRKLFK